MIYTLPLPLDPTRAAKDQSFTLHACFEVQLASVAILVDKMVQTHLDSTVVVL